MTEKEKIEKFKSHRKEDEMTNLDYILKNIDKKHKGEAICAVLYLFKTRHNCEDFMENCQECEFNNTIGVLKYLAEKHTDATIKVTQFEYDLLDSLKKTYSAYSKDHMNKFPIFTHMKEKGYFKNIENLNRLGEVCERMEVEDV